MNPHQKSTLITSLLVLTGCPDGAKTPDPGQATKSPDAEKTPKNPTTSYTPPKTRPDGDNTRVYIDPKPLTPASAKGFAPGSGSPEAAVLHFFASRMRGDERYEEVLQAERSDKLEAALERYEKTTFHEVELVKRVSPGEGSSELWIKVRMKTERDGKTNSWTDDVTVQKDGGKWWVVGLPT